VLAALFWAIHPLRVEAVVWLATRGYLLCTAFCLLTVLFYLRAAEQKRYPFAALLCFALATVTKGIGMMLPPVLLLIDWHGEWSKEYGEKAGLFRGYWGKKLVQKVPFFVLSLVTGVTAFLAKKYNGGMAAIEQYGLFDRLGQAVYGIWFYLLKTVSPTRLSPLYYKRPEEGAVMVALMLTGLAVVFLLLFRRKLRPMIGTFGAFLLLIFPMLGITQSGSQLFADRFTYLSAIPFSILLAAGLVRLTVCRRIIFGALAVFLMLFSVQAFMFSRLWNDNLSLWLHALTQDADNPQAYNSAGLALKEYQQYNRALEYFDRAIQLNPGYIFAWHNRAVVLAILGRNDEAFRSWRIALAIPGLATENRMKILLIRGWVFSQTGHPSAAERDYAAVIDIHSGATPEQRAKALQWLAALYSETGNDEQAKVDWKAVLQQPDPFGTGQSEAQAALDRLKKPDP
jgi:tetratricopeptide (TPR) repeat protein